MCRAAVSWLVSVHRLVSALVSRLEDDDEGVLGAPPPPARPHAMLQVSQLVSTCPSWCPVVPDCA